MDNKHTPNLPDSDELWKKHSEFIEYDMAVMMNFAGKVVMIKENFMKLWEELSNSISSELKQTADKTS